MTSLLAISLQRILEGKKKKLFIGAEDIVQLIEFMPSYPKP